MARLASGHRFGQTIAFALAGAVTALVLAMLTAKMGPPLAGAAVLAIAVAVFVAARPLNALLAALVVTLVLPYWYKFGLLILNFGAGLAVVSIITVTRRARMRWTGVDVVVVLTLLAAFIDWWAHGENVTAARTTFDTVSPLLFYFAARLLRGSAVRVVLLTLIGAVTIGSLTMFVEFAKGSVLFYPPGEYYWNGDNLGSVFRPAGVFGTPPAAVLVLAMVALIAIALRREVSRRRRHLLDACLALIVGAGVLTFTRAGWIGFGAGLITSVFVMWWQGDGRLPKWLMFVPVAAAAFVVALPTFSHEPWFQAGVERGGTLAYRQSIWSISLPLVGNTPQHLVFGHGLNSLVAGQRSEVGNLETDLAEEPILVQHSPHNQYLQTLLEQGVIGLVLLVGWLGGALASGLRHIGSVAPRNRRLVAALAGATVCYLVTSLAASTFREPNTVVVIALLTGLLVSLSNEASTSA